MGDWTPLVGSLDALPIQGSLNVTGHRLLAEVDLWPLEARVG